MLKTHKVLSRQRVKSYKKALHKEKGDCYLGKGSNMSNQNIITQCTYTINCYLYFITSFPNVHGIMINNVRCL